VKVCIRTDASIEIGSGHVMRCLTLAEALRDKGAKVVFICRELPGNLIGYIEDKEYFVHRLPAPEKAAGPLEGTKHAQWLGVPWQTDAREALEVLSALPRQKWLVIDHYALDAGWEKQMRRLVDSIMVIDDLADRYHECDLLLDQNLYEGMENRYNGLVPENCIRRLGPDYALLRPEFLEARNQLKRNDGTVKRILIFFGGCDSSNETAKALEALISINRPDFAVDVVVGESNPHKESIRHLCTRVPSVSFYCQVTTMAKLMIKADFTIGAVGTTTWERCAVGLPTIAISLADNQVPIAKSAEKAGVLFYLGDSKSLVFTKLCKSIRYVIENPELLIKMSENAKKLVDGEGTARVAAYLV
jgi:UDP-2,4-diacetamido-2,4,6-trideoxy-beta-L-altropyranose hydrolase